MQLLLRMMGWIVCVIYATIPSFWLLIHPRVDYWRSHSRSPYCVLIPTWIGMWIILGAITSPWRQLPLYRNGVDVGSCVCAFHRRLLYLQEFGKAFQQRPAGRCSRSCSRASGTAIGDHWHPGSRSPSGLPGPLMRDAGLDYGHGIDRLLCPHSVRCNLRCRHDPAGRCRT
jgi:hypothetical protein